MRLPVDGFLVDVTEYKGESDFLRGSLRCKCNCTRFELWHNGRHARRLFGESVRREKAGDFCIIARCRRCMAPYLLHASERAVPAEMWYGRADLQLLEPAHLRDNSFRLRVMYDWQEGEKSGKHDGFWDNRYRDAAVDIWNEDHPRTIRIFQSM